jgi:histidine decarboxylase
MTMNAVVAIRQSRTVDENAIRLIEIEQRMQAAHALHLGYPYNLAGQQRIPEVLRHYLINNLGDPYAGSHYGSEVCDLELEAVNWLMDLWQCDDQAAFWGSIGASGTEGNFWALYLAREAMPGAKLLYTDEAHYSIPKAARILGMETIALACDTTGALDMAALESALHRLEGKSVILAMTCGTTVKGAHDDIAAAMAMLDRTGFGPNRRYVHLDGALNAMVLPFIKTVPFAIQPSFRHGIDSLSTSGHKMIGTPMPCGVLITRKQHVDRIASAVAYLRSNDTTLMGSRNGHAVLSIWSQFLSHGREGYAADIAACLKRTDRLVELLRQADVPVLCNPHSLTVLFPQPSENIVTAYQLACHRGEAHAIVMPNVTDALINRFAGDYLDWWKNRRC